MTIRILYAVLVGLGFSIFSHAATATPPGPFTAIYDVSRDGSPIGQATITLSAAQNGQWTYRNEVTGTGGLAALLAASTSETSQFRWKGDVPEALRYDYRLQSAVKKKHRHVAVDWSRQQVSVAEAKGTHTYASRPGMVERNTLALAIGVALRRGESDIDLPVAARKQVVIQHFQITGHQSVTVPAGRFDTVQVERTDADRGFSAWYAPDRYPLPIKVSQHDGGNLMMELVSFRCD